MVEGGRKEKLTRGNQSSEKMLHLIETLSEQDFPMRLQDLARSLGMNSSTTLRFLTALQQNNYVAQEPETGRYYLTYKLCKLANNIVSRMSISRICEPYLRSIADTYGETTNLSVEQDMQVVYVMVLNGRNAFLTTHQRIGNIAPMHCTGSGKLMLLNFDTNKMDQFIKTKGLPRYTESTITTRDALLAQLQVIAQRGYAYDDEECEIGMRCVAAPIRDYSGRIIAGLSVSGPSVRMPDDIRERILQSLLAASRAISEQLGYHAADTCNQ